MRIVWILLRACACAVLIFAGCGRSAAPGALKIKDTGEKEITIMLPGDVPLVLERIKAGTFKMGRYPGEVDSFSKEDPQHTVTIAYDFYMGKYEVTQAQWLALMGAWPKCKDDMEGKGSFDKKMTPFIREILARDYERKYTFAGSGDNYPAYSISWNDTQDFISKLNKYTALTFRLPSEAEWEYACRAGTLSRFYWGDDSSGAKADAHAWSGENACQSSVFPVGQKLPNAFGLYDMSGNLYEWCQDYWHDTYTGAPLDGSAWESPTSLYRVQRVGNCTNFSYFPRSAARHYSNPATGNGLDGFRIAFTP